MSSNSTPSSLEGCIGLFRGNNSNLQGQNAAYRQYPPQSSSAKVPGMDRAAPTPNEMDRIIAKEMTDLSFQEREMAENDVHGIGTDGEEDPLNLQAGLLHLQRHLETMKQGTVYEEAERMNGEYVNDRDFRLMFLRADRYNPKEAAERMIRFFDLKKSLFGPSKLCQDITLDDLNEDDMETLRSGYLQLPPHKDMAGRTILVGMMKLRTMKAGANVVRQPWFGDALLPLDYSRVTHVWFIFYFCSSLGWHFTCSWQPWNRPTPKGVGWFASTIFWMPPISPV